MTIIAQIIDTDSLENGDFVAFKRGDKEFAGVFREFNDNGELDVEVIALGGIVSVAHEIVTDILA
ncbi:MAG: hypothetical protein Unbinned7865contig1001_15 [Prokaryotic dsDNA virus sp.]|nr:MAG: hypothetical protein Unbinned7865contig1001_15 [Prokaryotic dsDNA virus sp.]|tara:strand:- start:25179 stop:25373 length:195 start_codon:yes stop_codon:yes gene_type:complete